MAEFQSIQVPEETVVYAPGVADMYADSFQMSASAYTISLLFGLQISPKAAKPQVTVRMSAQHAKVMAIVFRRLLKAWEESTGEITIPQALLDEKQIDLTRDW